MAIFEAFVGNTDWSLAALHNIRLVRQQNSNILPLAYDLDFSGLVGTRYATPDPRLNIRNVKERLYRGPCKEPEELAPFFGVYREKKDAILKLYDETPGLDGRYRNDAKAFLTQWFKMLDNAARREVDVQGELQGRAGSLIRVQGCKGARVKAVGDAHGLCAPSHPPATLLPSFPPNGRRRRHLPGDIQRRPEHVRNRVGA